jgi:hypothetical protein
MRNFLATRAVSMVSSYLSTTGRQFEDEHQLAVSRLVHRRLRDGGARALQRQLFLRLPLAESAIEAHTARDALGTTPEPSPR